MTVELGMPHRSLPRPRRAARRDSSRWAPSGSAATHPISVQSMTTTVTADINATLQQIAELTAAGCDIVRVACPQPDDAEALPAIARKSQIPVIADIHFQPKYVFAAIEAGCAAVRVNPGNIKKFDDQVERDRRRRRRTTARPIRIGVNAGSLDTRLHGEVRQGHPGGAGRVGTVGGVAVRGARLPRLQDLGQAQRPGGHGAGLRDARRASATSRCTSASPRPARRSRAPSSRPWRSARCCPRASATPSGCRCRRRRSRRSRSATRSCSR